MLSVGCGVTGVGGLASRKRLICFVICSQKDAHMLDIRFRIVSLEACMHKVTEDLSKRGAVRPTERLETAPEWLDSQEGKSDAVQ